MSLVSTVKKAVRDRLIARAGGIDLTRLDKVPDSLSWPLQRDVMAPNQRISQVRDTGAGAQADHASSASRCGW